MALSAGYLIFASVMPLVKIYMSILCGYILAKQGLFGPAASKGASLIFMNLALPGLIFANIVPAFTPQNATAIGPLLVLAFTYQILGLVFGMIIREIFWVPRNFWQGIVVMCGMNNWSNLPNAVVMSITQQAPFDPITDTQLGVSYVSIFIVSYHIMFWVIGVAYTLAWDYLPGVPQGEETNQRVSWHEKPLGSVIARYVFRRGIEITFPPFIKPTVRSPCPDSSSEEPSGSTSPDIDASSPLLAKSNASSLQSTSYQTLPGSSKKRALDALRPRGLQRALKFTLSMFTPITSALYIALPIALVRPLKALFVQVPQSSGGTTVIWPAPDGRPPLAFVIDTAQWMGNLAVPLALIVLGASFARCHIPRPLSRLPISAMLACAAAKMIVLPLVGVCIVQAMIRSGWIGREAKVEQFVAMLLSGTPAAVNQLIVASLYAPNGDVDLQATFFLVQYVFMLFTSSALTAVSLLLI